LPKVRGAHLYPVFILVGAPAAVAPHLWMERR
jgi:hypothetical protein